MDFFTRFTGEKTPQNNFSRQNLSVENNYSFIPQAPSELTFSGKKIKMLILNFEANSMACLTLSFFRILAYHGVIHRNFQVLEYESLT